MSITRCELSEIHFWQRFSTAARPSKPSASHPGWAARARATSSATCSGATTGTLAITFPVDGFSTSIVPAAAAPFDPVPGTVVVSVTWFLHSSLSLGGEHPACAAAAALRSPGRPSIAVARAPHPRQRGTTRTSFFESSSATACSATSSGVSRRGPDQLIAAAGSSSCSRSSCVSAASGQSAWTVIGIPASRRSPWSEPVKPSTACLVAA